MLDGSADERKVTLTGADPFAEFHTPIKGKAKGRLTLIGIVGIMLGILIMAVGLGVAIGGNGDKAEEGFVFTLVGLGCSIACYLWARRQR